MRIHLLDMGHTKYGDCILVTHNDRKILIDGAHPGDTANIRIQLKTLLGQNPPFAFDLLVVTHCHSDHIGCLPALVSAGDVTAAFALVADEKLGWGRDVNGDSPVDAKGLLDSQKKLVAALQEEDHADLPAADLEQFLEDAATLEQKYGTMLETLAENGATIVRYGRDPLTKVQQIEAEFADFGLKVLGPTKNHLIKCAEAISQATDEIADAVSEVAADADPVDILNKYRQLSRRFSSDAEFAADQPGVGAAKNDQSLVLKIETDDWSALLAGDMQFAKAEVPGLNSIMSALRQKVVDAGPYDFIKFTHHTSYNALNTEILDEWSTTRLFAHTGGSNDQSHPDEGVLELLEGRQGELQFARTDRNGIITVEKVDGAVTLGISKGELNDFSVNVPEDLPENVETASESGKQKTHISTATVQRVSGTDVVEVVARIPHQATKVTLTIEIEPSALQEKKKN